MPTTADRKSLTKTALLNVIATDTALTRKQVNDVLEALADQVSKAMSHDGPGSFTLPGLVKIEKKQVAARPARHAVPNPFKPGEVMDVAAKPASTKIKVRPLKNLKDMA